MENSMTIKEVLEITARTIRSISLPVSEAETSQILNGCAGNLDACIEAIEKADKEAAKGNEPDTDSE